MTLNKHSQDNVIAEPDSNSDEPNISLESDMATLASLLTQCQDPPSEGQEHGDSQVAELLKRLTVADGVAKGVEERLDGIIENLDLLLTALEKESVDDHRLPAVTQHTTKEKEPSD
jgi:hypothetical protein